MKMKKFLIYYFICLILACISILILRVWAREKIVPMKVESRKKIVVISTITLEPLARVVRESKNGKVIFEWMKVKDAVLVMKEEYNKFYNQQEGRLNIYLQYDNCSPIY